MNANELADKRHDCQTFTELLIWGMDAKEMLRQQQAEIEALKTHPVELTNDEIRKVINEIVDGVTVSEMVTFLAISRAILRKAQER